jgi:hypothetical protein
MTVPVFMTAMVESAASRIRPASIRAKSLGGRNETCPGKWQDAATG